MKKKETLREVFFASKGEKNSQLVCYVAGYTAKIQHFRLSIRKLQKLNYDVIAFEYDDSVLTDGDPQKLIDIVKEVTKRVKKHEDNYTNIVCMGASLGSLISFNVQKRIKKARIGLYAAGGVIAAEALFGAAELSKEQKAFIANGYDQQKLSRVWKSLEIQKESDFPADKSFITVNGVNDVISKFNIAQAYMNSWKEQGAQARMIRLPFAGHKRTIMWYILNTEKLLRSAEDHHNTTLQ